MIEVLDGVIYFKNQRVGVENAGEIVFDGGIHHKTKEAVQRVFFRELEKENSDPEPEQDHRIGDKTPAWAAWLKRNKPEEFAERFKDRKIVLEEEKN